MNVGKYKNLNTMFFKCGEVKSSSGYVSKIFWTKTGCGISKQYTFMYKIWDLLIQMIEYKHGVLESPGSLCLVGNPTRNKGKIDSFVDSSCIIDRSTMIQKMFFFCQGFMNFVVAINSLKMWLRKLFTLGFCCMVTSLTLICVVCKAAINQWSINLQMTLII